MAIKGQNKRAVQASGRLTSRSSRPRYARRLNSSVSLNTKMIALSRDTEILVERIFRKESELISAKASLMCECSDNIPFCKSNDSVTMERIRFAVIKVSGGDFVKLNAAIEQAKIDWRDLLVAAGFANDTEAHKKWARQVIT